MLIKVTNKAVKLQFCTSCSLVAPSPHPSPKLPLPSITTGIVMQCKRFPSKLSLNDFRFQRKKWSKTGVRLEKRKKWKRNPTAISCIHPVAAAVCFDSATPGTRSGAGGRPRAVSHKDYADNSTSVMPDFSRPYPD